MRQCASVKVVVGCGGRVEGSTWLVVDHVRGGSAVFVNAMAEVAASGKSAADLAFAVLVQPAFGPAERAIARSLRLE